MSGNYTWVNITSNNYPQYLPGEGRQSSAGVQWTQSLLLSQGGACGSPQNHASLAECLKIT